MTELYHERGITRRAFLRTALVSATGLWVAGRVSAPVKAQTAERWATSTGLNITIHSAAEPARMITDSHNDFKPSWSPDGSMLTFFRATRYGNDFKDWRSMICVINADGTELRELTTDKYPNFNPTWTRDGSNKIIFNRFSPNGNDRNQVFWVDPTAAPGDEELLSDPDFTGFEWGGSGLRDGRIFVDRGTDRGFRSFLLTPDPGGQARYEEIERPTSLIWHKLTVSPSEARVAYMLDNDNNIPTYNDSVICYAAFDVEGLRIYDQVQITELDRSSIQEYPAWNHDESLLIYDSNKTGTYQLYAYDMAEGTTTMLLPNLFQNEQFGDFEGCPK